MAAPSIELPPPESVRPEPAGASLPPRASRSRVIDRLRSRRGRRTWGEEADGADARSASMGPAVGLSALSTVLAGVVAYGTHPAWARFRHGLDVILLSRQLQWPFFVLSLIAAPALLATIIAGRRRAWWLLGLAPVLALFAHRFATDPTAGMASVEDPMFVAPDAAAAFLADDDYVVGLTFAGRNYAYPYAALYSTPAVIHAQHDKRVLILWSAPANRALAFTISREVRARNLDVVSTPANALLVYDTARGVFINGITGRTPEGRKPAGFLNPVPAEKMTWRQWRATHPQTQVMAPVGKLAAAAPRRPMRPIYPMPAPAAGQPPADLPVALVGLEKPVALPSGSVTSAPINVTADDVPVLAFRDPQGGVPRAFRRRLDDLSPRFKPNRDKARKGVLFIDTDTGSGWSADGVVVEGRKEFRGKRLPPAMAEDGLAWGVMKFWYPDLRLVEPESGSGSGAPHAVIELTGTGATTRPADGVQADTQSQRGGGITVKPSRRNHRTRR